MPSALMLPDGQDDVLALKVPDQRVHLNTHGRQLSGIDLQPDPFVLGAKKVDLGDPRQPVEPLAEVVRGILHFPVRKSLGRHRDRRDRDVAEVAVDERAEHPVGQVGLDVDHLVTQPLPAALTSPTSSFRST